MFRRTLTVLLVFVVLNGSAFGAGNTQEYVPNDLNTNITVNQLQNPATHLNSAKTVIVPVSTQIKATIDQLGKGAKRTAEQQLQGESHIASITQRGNLQWAKQVISGKGHKVYIDQSGKNNKATQNVAGFDNYPIVITQEGKSGIAVQNIGQESESVANQAKITQTSKSNSSKAYQTVNGNLNVLEITQGKGVKNVATQTITGDENEAIISQTGNKNHATQTIVGNENVADTTQHGSNNQATTDIESWDNEVIIDQDGNKNKMTVTITGGQYNGFNWVDASQNGNLNQGDITIEDSELNDVTLQQSGNAHKATINITGSDLNTVSLVQTKGKSNKATIDLIGTSGLPGGSTTLFNDLSIKQKGSNNVAKMTVEDTMYGTGSIVQNGNNNLGTMLIEKSSNVTATVTQIGNNLETHCVVSNEVGTTHTH